jgi:glycosyltransferase involved in cell wall biosynthesis
MERLSTLPGAEVVGTPLAKEECMARRLRVAQLIQYFGIGGIERMVEGLVPAFDARGVDTVVAAYRGDGPVRAALEARGAPAVLLPGRSGLDPLLPFRLARWIRTSGADVLHTHHLGPFIYGAAAARLAGVPHVHTEHSHEIYDAPRRLALGRRMDGLATVVAVSEEIAAWRESAMGRRCIVIPNGVPVPPAPTPEDRTQARRLLGVEEGDVVVGCVARLAPEKDHATLVRAIHSALPAAPALRLVLIGDGPERGGLEALASELGVNDRILFLGARSDVGALLPGLDLFTLASRREGLPLSLLEALASGVPAVTTAVGEMPRVLAGGAGRTVPSGNVADMAAVLAGAALDPDWRRLAGIAGRELVRASYSMEAMADAYVHSYRAALHGRRAA